MQVVKRAVAPENDEFAKHRLSALSMYSTPPDEQISVTEFEDYAFDRLRCALAIFLLNPLPPSVTMAESTRMRDCRAHVQCSARLK